MSIQTWTEEFYPEHAHIFNEKDALDAVRHSILKWEGLQPENMKKHDVHWDDDRIADDGAHTFIVDGRTCALCVISNDVCERCPLYKVRDNVACDDERNDEDLSPWHLKRHRPQVMLMWLKAAEKYQQRPQPMYTGGL